MIQPYPHDPANVPDEILQMIYKTNSADELSVSGNEVPSTQRIK